MRIVFSPDSLKGSATAAEAARALAEGWQSIRPGDHLTIVPMADGGEGTVDAVAAALPHCELRSTRVRGPDGSIVDAAWLHFVDGAGRRTALVELAEASGLLLLSEPAPLTAHTLGLGEVMRAALDSGVERLLIAVGGSCSTDGGAGALHALGATLVDEHGAHVPLGNAGLHALDHADLNTAVSPPSGGAVVLTDVDNPLLGSRGAVAVFGAQKGIDDAMAPDAERALERFAAALVAGPRRASGVVSPSAAGAGAAGGVGFGLLSWGAELAAGAREIAETIGLPTAIADADLVITGEGRFDGQSAGGKAPVEVARLAAAAGVPCALVAGAIDAPTRQFSNAVSLTELAGSVDAAMSDPLQWLRNAGERFASAQPAD